VEPRSIYARRNGCNCCDCKDYGLQVAAHAHGDDGCNVLLKRIKRAWYRNEWCYYGPNDKVQWVLYAHAFCGWVSSRKASTPNYYPAIVVQKHWQLDQKLATLLKHTKKVPNWFRYWCSSPHGEKWESTIYMNERLVCSVIKTIQAATIVNATILQMENKN
jgi:hypothetical protein